MDEKNNNKLTMKEKEVTRVSSKTFLTKPKMKSIINKKTDI